MARRFQVLRMTANRWRRALADRRPGGPDVEEIGRWPVQAVPGPGAGRETASEARSAR